MHECMPLVEAILMQAGSCHLDAAWWRYGDENLIYGDGRNFTSSLTVGGAEA